MTHSHTESKIKKFFKKTLWTTRIFWSFWLLFISFIIITDFLKVPTTKFIVYLVQLPILHLPGIFFATVLVYGIEYNIKYGKFPKGWIFAVLFLGFLCYGMYKHM